MSSSFGALWFHSCDTFKETVEGSYNLNKDQVGDVLLNVQPAPVEDAVVFVLKVEYTCISLNVDIKLVFLALFPCLPGELKQRLEVSIEMSYVWGVAYSMDCKTFSHITQVQPNPPVYVLIPAAVSYLGPLSYPTQSAGPCKKRGDQHY